MAHDPDTKAQVIAALLTGQGVNEVAEQYRIPKSTVSGWKRQISESELNKIELKKAHEIGEMILGYVAQNLSTVTSQLETAGDREWLRKQSASEFAVLHGVLIDKAVRILGAIDTEGEAPTE